MFKNISATEIASVDRNKPYLKEMLQELQKKKASPFLFANIPLHLWPIFEAQGFAQSAKHPEHGIAQGRQLSVYAINGSIASVRFPRVPCSVVTLPLSKQSIKVLRLDQLHPLLMGNKWFKLKYNLYHAKKNGYSEILTFGGVYSNHLFATAAAGKMLGFTTRGMVRGEPVSNPVIDTVLANGMQCEYWTRQDYRQKHLPEVQKDLQQRFPKAWIVPEGGSNPLGEKGAGDIWEHIIPHLPENADIFMACGTGSTLSGLLKQRCQRNATLHGIAVLKGAHFLKEVAPKDTTWELHLDFHGGGYARLSGELKQYLQAFGQLNANVPIEHVYTAKMFRGIDLLLQQKHIKAEHVLALHTGGIYF